MTIPAILMAYGLFAGGAFAPQKTIAVPVEADPPVIDGNLDDPIWKDAVEITGFTNFQPIEDTPMSQQTVVRLLRDDRNLYLAFDCKDTEPSKVRATFADRDNIFQDDWVMVVLDPFEDQRRGVLLVANPYGIQSDLTHDDSNGGNEDSTWDAIWFSAGRKTADGYQVEMQIPFASLRFDPAHDGWGFNVARYIPRDNEKGSWAPVRAAGGPLLAQDGEISGMRGLPIGFTAEVIPEFTMRGGPAVDVRDSIYRTPPGHGPWNGRGASDVGVTATVSRAGTAGDLTIHPDFSQVESDPAKIATNQRFALFFDEKRPFFLEGRSYFNGPLQAVYTRTIVDPIYGLKVTGKQGPTAYAVLNAVDQAPADSIVDPRWNRAAYGDHQAVTTIARASSDLAQGFTMGVTATDKHIGDAWNRVGGVDANFSVGSWMAQGQTLWSGTDHPTGEYQEGTASYAALAYGDRHVGWFSYAQKIDDGFRAESGFIPRVGFMEGYSDAYHRWETGRKSGLLAWRIGGTVDVIDSTANTDATRDFTGRVRFEFPSVSYFVLQNRGWERFGGVAFDKTRTSFEINGAPLKWLSFDLQGSAGDEISYFQPVNPYLGRSATAGLSSTFQPLDRMRIGVGYDRKAFVTGDLGDAFRQISTRSGKTTAFDVSVSNVNAQWFFTQAVSARVITTYDDTQGRMRYSTLLSWRPSPGTVTYLGYQDSLRTKRGIDVSKDRAVFFKLSYLFRY